MLAPSTPLATSPTLYTAAAPRSAQGEAVLGARHISWLTIAILGAAFTWCFWPTFQGLVYRWIHQPRYSHGFLVPLFAAGVLWARRPKELPRWEPSAWGLPMMVAATLLRFLAVRMDNQPLDGVSLLAMLAGLVLLVGGRRVLGWTWPAIAFIAFMIPLPFFIEMALTYPLQTLVTSISTFALQTIGLPALADGNIITIGQTRLAIVESCSGLGMLMTFFALAVAVALIVKAPRGDRWVIVASAVPIGIFANAIRVTITAWAYHVFGAEGESVRAWIHDLAGWLMMPLALALMWLELKYLGWLFVPVNRHDPVLGLRNVALPNVLSNAQAARLVKTP
ncbi:MAG: exosortase/archaeosortase family protein [Gemmataceae bacterium]|nr:exosortase/archaeosortase family protein [Gemmataceae bacterium]